MARASRRHPTLFLTGGMPVRIREVQPRDAETLQAYVRRLSPTSRRNRFLGSLSELPQAELDRVTHLDQRSQSALLAVTDFAGASIMIGEMRLSVTPDRHSSECALSVADEWQGRGLGTLLIKCLECRARALRVQYLTGDVLRSNVPMQRLAQKARFSFAPIVSDWKLVRIVKDLSAGEAGLPCEKLVAVPRAA